MLEPSRLLPGPDPRSPDVLPIEAQGIGYAAGGRQLLADVDLTLVAGRRTVVLGPNGAGKSLLLRILDGLVQPTSGTVTHAGQSPGGPGRASRAFLFQRPVLLRRSVAANIGHALSARGVAWAERGERIRAALAAARLGHLAGQPARLLSGGEQQRLALARALALAPRVLFLDEPTASLDPASTLAVEDLVEAAGAAGIRIVLVTHDPGQARRHADEVVFMQAGRIAEITPAAEFFDRPRTEAARAYLAGRIHV